MIERLPPPMNVKGVRNFLGYAGFYRRFIKDFSKISKTHCSLVVKENDYVFDDECFKSFSVIKEKLVIAPIIISPT